MFLPHVSHAVVGHIHLKKIRYFLVGLILLFVGATVRSAAGVHCLIPPSTAEPKQVVQSQQIEAQPLQPGNPLERELAGGQRHLYQITLTAGQYLNVVVEQRGIDVAVLLGGPDKKMLLNVNNEARKEGTETLEWVAAVAGTYYVTLQAVRNELPAGKYLVQVTALREATAQEQTLQEARQLSAEYNRLFFARKYDEALPMAERVLQIREKELGPEHPLVATSLFNIANLHYEKGDYAKAEPFHQRALVIREKALGLEHPDVAQSLFYLANLYQDKADFAKAELFHQRAQGIWEKTLGPNHPIVATLLNNLAELYRTKGDYPKAESFNHQALEIVEKAFGTNHPAVAISLNNLAALYNAQSEYGKAEPFYQRALGIWEKAFGPNHPNVAASINNLAALYSAKGDFAKAEPFYQRAAEIWEKTLGPNHPNVATAINNLAYLYNKIGEYEKAEPLIHRALEIGEKTLGPDHPSLTIPLSNLALLYRSRGEYEKAEPLDRRALEIGEKALGPNHPNVAISLNNLAELYSEKGDYAKAEPLVKRALEIREKALGTNHPEVATSLHSLASLYVAKGEVTQAVAVQARANAINERNIDLNLAASSERQKLAYLAMLLEEADQTLSLHLQASPTDLTARNLATTTILQRKGRALDATSDSIGALRRRFTPQDQALLDQWQDTNAQLARLVLNGPPRGMSPIEHQQRIKALEEQKEQYEAQISRHSAQFHVQSQPVTLAAIQATIPANTALVEFYAYRRANPKYAKRSEQFGPPHYAAYVLRQRGDVAWVELGEAKVIDAAADALRQALRDTKRSDVKTLARALDEKVMRPVRKLLGETKHVLLSPDGALNLVPFAALVDEQNRYLVEQYEFSYLTSGRDLLRLQVPRESQGGPLIVADPAFGERGMAGTLASRDITHPEVKEQNSNPQFSLLRGYFPPLPGTADEARALKAILPQATVFTREQATKAALRQVHAPRILHIATHGFFLQSANASSSGSPRTGQPVNVDSQAKPQTGLLDDPSLRSGLALAGANLRREGEDNGVLTAKEAAGLDLWGTKLVVLSACDTGVGEVKNGEGVHGLRRALVLAGSETQVMSLWPVSDLGTRDLMIAYYQALQRGEGRGGALRKVQLQFLQNPARRHPYYWASFIQSGEWANLAGKR